MADSELVIGIPETLSGFLGGQMLCLTLPSGDSFEAAPIGNRDAKTVCVANGLDAKKSWLLRGKLNHSVSNLAVAPLTLAAL